MTHQQIVILTTETGRRVAANEIGVAPRSDRHLRRLEELKRNAREQEQATDPQSRKSA
jgi:hypothetical protein